MSLSVIEFLGLVAISVLGSEVIFLFIHQAAGYPIHLITHTEYENDQRVLKKYKKFWDRAGELSPVQNNSGEVIGYLKPGYLWILENGDARSNGPRGCYATGGAPIEPPTPNTAEGETGYMRRETTALNALISFYDAIDEVASDCECEGAYDEENPCPRWDDHAKIALGMIEPIERLALVGLGAESVKENKT